ncbi:MAG: hypothetical protein M1820_008229 [Bogoriella megaspora]|nr:MAG: hypothetical protein M1820_008229 [Bogoriella megaspora]
MGANGYSKLSDSEAGIEDGVAGGSPPFQRPWSPGRIAFISLILCNIIFSSLWLREKSKACVRPQLTYSPALGVISYEKKHLMRNIEDNVFTGDPRPEHDAAWRRIIEPMTIKVSQDDLDQLNETSIAFRDRSGFIAELAVYHELHCIVRSRRPYEDTADL